MIGVMPMPPAMNTKLFTFCGSSKSLTGSEHRDAIADFDAVDQADRAAATIGFALDRDDVTVAFARIVAQRIFADRTVRHGD